MKASEALEMTRGAVGEQEVQRQLEKAYEEIANAAKAGKREVILCHAVEEHNNPAFEAVKAQLLADGYRIERKSVFWGCWQDPADYLCW